MIDRAFSIAGLAITIIGAILPTIVPAIPKRIGWVTLAIGLLFLGCAAGIAFSPDGEAQQPPAVNQGPGSAYSYGQQGGITAGTLNIAPSRLAFSDDLGNALLARMPEKKKVIMFTVGGNADQSAATNFQVFLQRNGYEVQRKLVGMMVPPPDRPISVVNEPNDYVLTIAPSVH